MNRRIIPIAAIVVFFALGFLYLNQNYLIANDKDGTNCYKTSCGSMNKETGTKAGGEFSSYGFTTESACCDEMKTELSGSLMSIQGVKEVKFSTTCSVSKMTNVTVLYAAGETSEEIIAASVKEKSYDCSGKSCDKEGMKSGSQKDGCDTKNECPGMKMKQKSKDSKQL